MTNELVTDFGRGLVEDVVERVKQLEAELAAERAAKEKLQRDVEILREDLAKTEAMEAHLERERDEARAEVEKLRTYNRTFEPVIERLSKERDDACERLAQVEADAAALRGPLEQWSKFVEACMPNTEPDPGSLQGETKAALATNAGKPLLDEVARKTAALEKISEMPHSNPTGDTLHGPCPKCIAEAALADGGKAGT